MASDLAKKYNLKSPGVKRLMREAAELSDPTDQYFAQPLEDNLFEWHFTVRGPPDTEFDDGRYHGRITLPPEYPMKPPSIILITPNGRFEIGKKICLSMSAHHPETWQPSWSIRTVLLAIIGFMPTPGGGAIGALNYTPEERTRLAKKSKEWKCETCGCDGKTVLLERDPAKEKQENEEAKEVAAQISLKAEEKAKATNTHSPPSLAYPISVPQQQQQEFVNNMSPQQYYGMYQNAMQQPGQFLQNSEPQPLFQQQQQPQQQSMEGNNSEFSNSLNQESTATESSSPTTGIPNNNTGLRQRAAVSAPVSASDPADNADSSESSSSHRPQTLNRHSRTEQVTLVLTWIVTIALVILVLRRLAMDGTSMTK